MANRTAPLTLSKKTSGWIYVSLLALGFAVLYLLNYLIPLSGGSYNSRAWDWAELSLAAGALAVLAFARRSLDLRIALLGAALALVSGLSRAFSNSSPLDGAAEGIAVWLTFCAGAALFRRLKARVVTAFQPPPASILRGLGMGVLFALPLGTLTLFGQGILPGSWNHFANSGAVWLTGAFLVGSCMPSYRWAAPAGVVTLFGALAGYTLAAAALGFAYTLSALAFWGVVGLAGGPVFGAAGYAWRAGGLRPRVIGAGLLGAVFAAEGWFMLQYNHDLLAGWVSIAIGLLLAIFLARSAKERLYTLLVMLPLTGLGIAVFALTSTLV